MTEPLRLLSGATKNRDLVMLGELAVESDFSRFTPSNLTNWEMAAYEAYDAIEGTGACERLGIDTLADMFGQEASNAFFRHKHALIVQAGLPGLRREIERLQELAIQAQSFLENPAPQADELVWAMAGYGEALLRELSRAVEDF